MNPLNIVFMGSPDFAIPSLDKIHESVHRIQAVVSNPDKRRRRRGSPEPTPVKKRALELGLSTIDVDDLHSNDFHAKLESLKPDLLVVVAFRILPPSILSIPGKGSINLHASLLPKYRGAAPIHWAVINGEKETGCTVFFLNKTVDTGEIIGQVHTRIGEFETTGNIYNRLREIGSDLLLDSIDQIAEGAVKTMSQDDELATPAPKLFKENTKIDFDRTAVEIHNFIRGLNPFPVAWCRYGDQKMNVYATEPVHKNDLQPGELSLEENKLLVGCSTGAVEIKRLQLPGTKKLSGRDFANGYNLDIRLE